jgi:predicted Zn-dependent peptidase
MTTRTKSTAFSGVYRKTVLKNGLRIVTETISAVRSVSLGVWIDVGSRNESRSENGLSHFIEHMLFKGTRKRDARELAAALEELGGGLNGFTSREQTCFYARCLDEHLPVAVDVLADLTCNSRLAAVHVQREKSVVCEEIKEALDTPSDLIHDLFARTYWGEHPLGQPIMGTMENIQSLTRPRTVDFMKRHYRADSVVVAACGSMTHEEVVQLARKHFEFDKGESEEAVVATRSQERQIIIKSGDNKQTHFCLGFPSPRYDSPDKMTTLALSAYLGGGMSSVLFQKIREDRGLAYTVYSFNDFYRDSGVFGVYLGTDGKRIRQACEVVLGELRRVKRKKLTASQLHKLKSQMKGHLVLSQEATNSRMNRLARQELMTGKYQTLEKMLKDIDDVTASGIAEMAGRIFDESKAAVAVLGPVPKGVFDGVI